MNASGSPIGGTHILSTANRLRVAVAPILLVVVFSLACALLPPHLMSLATSTLITSAMVIGLYIFTGNSGVISFGHISFVAIGAFTTGALTIATAQKQLLLPKLLPLMRDHTLGSISAVLAGTLLAALVALVVGAGLMRLNGLTASIATFAVLVIVNSVYRNWTTIGPGATTLAPVPTTVGLKEAAFSLCVVILIAAWHQVSVSNRRLRATREDGPAAQSIGINVYRERMLAFVVSGAISGFAGGVYVLYLGSIDTSQVYLSLTFVTLAMLIIGGMQSLWGAALGGILIGSLSNFLVASEQGLTIGSTTIHLTSGSASIGLPILLIVILLFRPLGITGSKEFLGGSSWRRLLRRPPRGRASQSTYAVSGTDSAG